MIPQFPRYLCRRLSKSWLYWPTHKSYGAHGAHGAYKVDGIICRSSFFHTSSINYLKPETKHTKSTHPHSEQKRRKNEWSLPEIEQSNAVPNVPENWREMRQLPEWKRQMFALKEKFHNEPWNPSKKLSREAMEGIRMLKKHSPQMNSGDFARLFKISPEAVRRILRSKWQPSEKESDTMYQRWISRGKRIKTDQKRIAFEERDIIEKGVTVSLLQKEMGRVERRSGRSSTAHAGTKGDRKPRITGDTDQARAPGPTDRKVRRKPYRSNQDGGSNTKAPSIVDLGSMKF